MVTARPDTTTATHEPPGHLRSWDGVLRVAEREIVVFAKSWHGSVFSAVVTPLLFLGAMGLGLGGLIDARGREVEGLSYLEFLAPGLLAASVFQNAAQESMWAVMGGMKWVRSFHGMAASPLRPADVYAGFVLYTGAFRSLVTAVPFILVAAVLGGVPSWWGALALPAAMLGAFVASAPLAAYAATQESDASFGVLSRVVITPLFLLSGTFFPVGQLPEAIQPLAWLSPLWHAAELARAATTGRGDPWVAVGHVAVLLAVIAAGAAWGRRTFARALTP